MIYDIVNPSDACTIEAPDDKTAIVVVTLLGEGAYGLEAEDGRRVCGLSLFGGAAQEILDAFPPDPSAADATQSSVAAMMTWAKEHAAAVADAFDSFVYGDKSERAFLAEVVAQAKDPAKVKAAHADRRRSSMNNIGARAAAYAKHMRSQAAVVDRG